MNLYIRLLATLVASLFQPSVRYDEPSERRFRVWLHDLDAFGHMNNGRYLQIMDVARVDWMLRSGVAAVIRRGRYTPLLGGGLTHFRHPLKLFQSYSVRTRLVHWDRRWFYLEHAFVDGRGRRVAVGVSRAALRTRSGWADTDAVARAVDEDAVSPVAPSYIESWLASDGDIARRVKPLPETAEPVAELAVVEVLS